MELTELREVPNTLSAAVVMGMIARRPGSCREEDDPVESSTPTTVMEPVDVDRLADWVTRLRARTRSSPEDD